MNTKVAGEWVSFWYLLRCIKILVNLVKKKCLSFLPFDIGAVIYIFFSGIAYLQCSKNRFTVLRHLRNNIDKP